MNYVKLEILCIFAALLFVGCGCSDGSGSTITSRSPYVHEREFANNSDFYAQPDQVVVLYLESTNDPGPEDEDTGGIADDLVKIRFGKEKGHEFELEVPEGDLFKMTVTGPDGIIVTLLDRDNPSATVDVDEGVHSLAITHGGGTGRNRALFIRPGSTIVSKDCPGCNLSGINLRYHNLSAADMTGADLSYADLSYANLEYADVTDSVRQGTNMESAIVTGMTGTYPAPETCDPSSGGSNCYTVYPAQCSSGEDTDYAQIIFYQCDSDGSNVSINGTTIGHSSSDPEGIQLQDGLYWYVTIEDSYYKQPYSCVIKTSDSAGWSYAGQCSQSSPVETDKPCGGCQCMEPPTTSGSKVFRTLCNFENNSSLLFNRFYLLDKQNGNLLFRGPAPCAQEGGTYTFDYSDVMQYFQTRYKQQVGDGKFPDKITFLDISLISDGPGEQNDVLTAEYEFFGGTGTPTCYASQPSEEGTYVNLPAFTVNSTGNSATVKGQFWWWYMQPKYEGATQSNIDELAEKLRNWMATDNTGDDAFHYVIYIHCDAGTDRTGEATISYLLKNKNMSSKEAFVYGSTTFQLAGTSWIKGRLLPNEDYWIGAAWYNCMLCNGNSPKCDDLVSACPTETSPCSECQSGCSDCSDLICWDFSDTTSVPGSKAYPNAYPWSTDNWGPGCGQ